MEKKEQNSNNGKNGKNGSLTITHIRMYEELLDKELNPVIRILEARGSAIKDRVTVEVKRDMGIYDLTMKKFQLEAALDEVKRQLKEKTEKRYLDVNGERKYVSPVDAEIERRVNEINSPLIEVTSFRDNLVKEIKLACGTPEIRAMFEKLMPEVQEWMEKVKKLPPLKLKKLTEADQKVLAYTNYY
jgi:hypothetical protein